jgi:ABC-type multidrug transport system fused ATPase/permease subunit
MFSGTIRDNLDPQGDCDDATLQRALDSSLLNASASDRNSLPSPGLETTLCISRMPSEMGVTRPSSVIDEDFTAEATPPASFVTAEFTLDTPVAPHGSNFSQGQRQLISLARAIVRQSAIVLSDEATSSVDHQTDALLQAALTHSFKNSALIVVAHRLSTVMSFDRIMVMDAGRIVEK